MKSNRQRSRLVAAASRRGDEFSNFKAGQIIATAEDARRILKTGVTYNSVEETLQNLGLPPNREAGQRGFIGYPATDGKIRPPQVGGSDGHPLAGQH